MTEPNGYHLPTPGQHVPPIPPEPVSIAWEHGVARDPDGSAYVVLVIHTPGSTTTYLLTPDLADAMADENKRVARIARTGLITP